MSSFVIQGVSSPRQGVSILMMLTVCSMLIISFFLSEFLRAPAGPGTLHVRPKDRSWGGRYSRKGENAGALLFPASFSSLDSALLFSQRLPPVLLSSPVLCYRCDAFPKILGGIKLNFVIFFLIIFFPPKLFFPSWILPSSFKCLCKTVAGTEETYMTFLSSSLS